MISKRPMFTKMKGQVIRVVQRSEMSQVNWLDSQSTCQAGEQGWIIMAQNLLSAIKVLDPEMVGSRRQAYIYSKLTGA